MAENKIHHGRNVKRFRETMGLKQEALAAKMGSDWNQKRISLLEQKEVIDTPLLVQLSKALEVPREAIENFTEEAAANYFNTFNDGSFEHGTFHQGQNTINNPIEKWLEAMEENKKLYERLLQSEREKVEILQKLVGK
ncbi:helix-turn-helix domain-containing protein [Chitinophagaceae bacterium MMS25-I14]